MPFDFDARIADWRKSLLDTTKRNRLIKFATGRSGGVNLVHPPAADLWNCLVREGRTLSFPWKRELLGLPREILDAETLAADFDPQRGTANAESGELSRELTNLCLRSQNLRPTDVLTDMGDRQLASRFVRLSRSAKEAETDHGVTTLFAAFGFLCWFERTDSQEEILSPLLLVPIRFQRETIESPFTFKATEDDHLPNHCLAELLENQFKLKLPTPASIGVDPESAEFLPAYFRAVSQSIGTIPNWSVRETAAIGVFNFQKLAMWEDLGRNAARLKAHPLCRAVAGDAHAIRNPPNDLPGAVDLDRLLAPGDANHILDADSSQHEAIEAVKRGADLVLDGPPGTGKSQTIANIIAEMLAAGKTVLFVSAKVSALEVVKRRLDACGLGDFCLELHSQKASKKEVASELGRCLELAPSGMPNREAIHRELAESRSKLNELVAELHAVRAPLGWSAYRVHGELARIEGKGVAGRSRIAIAEPFAKDAEYVRKGAEILAGLADCHAVLDEPGGHPWKGCRLTSFSHSVRDDTVYSLKQLAGILPAARSAAESLEAVGLALPDTTVPGWIAAEAHAQRILAAPLFPADWFRGDPHATSQAILELDGAAREARDSSGRLTEFDLAAVRAMQNPQEAAFATDRERLVSGSSLSARERLAALEQLKATLQSALEKVKMIAVQSREVAQLLKLGTIPTFNELPILAQLASRLAQPAAVPLSWWDTPRHAELLAAVKKAASEEGNAQSQRATLVSRLAPAALAPESSPLAREAAEAARLFWHWLPWSHWAKVRKSLGIWYPAGLPNGSAVRSDVAELGLYHSRMDAAWQVATAYKAELFVDSSGKADWAATEKGLQDIEQLGKWKVAPELKAIAGPKGKLDRSGLAERSAALESSMKAFADEWAGIFKRLTVGDTASILGKNADDLIAWLEAELAGTLAEAKGLASIVALLSPSKDVTAAVLPDRLLHLRKLIAARIRIDTAAKILQESRSLPELEAVDHANSAQQATQLLAFLKAWDQPLTAGAVAALTDNRAREKLGGILRDSQSVRPEFDRAWSRIAGPLFDADTIISTDLKLNGTALDPLRLWTDNRIADIDRLAEWLRFLQVEKDASAFGIGGILDEVKAGEFGPKAAADSFRARFYRLWLDSLHRKVPILGSFSTGHHERSIARFAELDRLAIRTTPAHLRHGLLANPERPIAREGVPESSELGILLREVHKKQRHIPLRQLFAQIPWVLPRLKPCLMMSPLAVSTFLDNPDFTFDLVIFDEASQVRPHDAVCAIYRGRQLVVGGDPKQLPPTDFFNRGSDDDEPTSEDNALDSYESLLDVCLSRGLIRKWLRWHYRSQRESLIAFSNRHFYESRLITFPSADEVASPAIQFVKVQDGRFRDGINPIEAKRVANSVMEHARTSPTLSLGVIAFSQRQQERILDELDALRRKTPEAESFFADGVPEPFFVKNLENVQGDERDIIFLDIGYGPGDDGKVAMRFGPLNQRGGERRLNVAITRARRGMTVISSITAADIDLERTQAEGARLLKAFLDYAARGTATLGELNAALAEEIESTFEKEVGDELVRRGLKVERRIGCGGYRIDLAIADAQRGGGYLLGIECDGATYRSAATARDRDRLRQAILEGLGWRLLRVWSAEWIRNRDEQVKRILQALEDAALPRKTQSTPSFESITQPTPKASEAKPLEFDEIENVPDSALSNAIRDALLAFGSMPAEELTAAVSRRLGFKRTGPKIRDRIVAAINESVLAGKVGLSEESRIRLNSTPRVP